MFEQFCDRKIPDNRFISINDFGNEELIIGGTNIHTFILPFDYTTIGNSLKVIYKQGLDFSFELTEDDCEIMSLGHRRSLIRVELPIAKSLLFKTNWLEASVQLKVSFNNEENKINYFYTEPQKLKLLKPLDQI